MLEAIQKDRSESYWIEEALLPVRKLWMQKKDPCTQHDIESFWEDLLNTYPILEDTIVGEFKFCIKVESIPHKHEKHLILCTNEVYEIHPSIIKSCIDKKIKFLTMFPPDSYDFLKQKQEKYPDQVSIEKAKKITEDEYNLFSKVFLSITKEWFPVYLHIKSVNINYLSFLCQKDDLF